VSKDTTRRLIFDPDIDRTNPNLPHHAALAFSRKYVENRRILDIGCWNGNYEFLLSDIACKVIGMDLELSALRMATAACPSHSFLGASALNVPFADSSFDTVTMWEVLEHLPIDSEQAVLGEIRRVLNPGGHLVLSTPYDHWLLNWLDPGYFLTGHRHYRLEPLITMLSVCGFRVVEKTTKGGIVELSSMIAFYAFKHLLHREIPRMEWLDRLRRREFADGGGSAHIYIVASKVNSP
jgi:ubiquinone/menaquinone biosynthesis C-methylase UbiE